MFRLFKWLIIAALIGSIWFLFNFFKNLNDEDQQAIKKDAIEAIGSGDAHKLVDPLHEKLKVDFTEKKTTVLERAQEWTREHLDQLFDYLRGETSQ